MISYEFFFVLIMISILSPFMTLLGLFLFQLKESEIERLSIENKKVIIEKELEVSQLSQLSQQIQPHFLFNTLNSLFSLLRMKKYTKLNYAMEELTLYLRKSYNINTQKNTIENELSYTLNYLNIQKIRFGNKLKIELKINEELLEDFIISYLLQTLVENCFKHGFEGTSDDFLLYISITTEGDSLLLLVENNGNPIQNKVDYQIGLTNINNRLKLMYGSSANLTYENTPIGTCFKCKWPRRHTNENINS